MIWVAGADGCRGGWTIVWRRVGTDEIDVEVVGRAAEVLLHPDRFASRLGIDIPIGLLDAAARGGREADRRARKLLGPKRGTSVFPAPVRGVLSAGSFPEACARSRASSESAIGITKQTYALVEKIREVDEMMSPARQDRIVEVHPELSFFELNEQVPVVAPKRSAEGLAQRVGLLERRWHRDAGAVVDRSASSDAARDDIVDAMAACWTAERVLAGKAVRVPDDPPRDARGLRMEIQR